MDTNYDIPFDEYGFDDTPYVTKDEMIDLLKEQVKNKNNKIWQLEFDKNSGLYFTDYFVYHGDMLQEHLLAEQIVEHMEKGDKFNWVRITNGYDFDIVPHIQHLIENPLVWIDEMPYELSRKYVVTGKVAEEKSSEERSTFSTYDFIRIGIENERIDWFAKNLPTKNNLFNKDYNYYDVPDDMILWNLLLTSTLDLYFYKSNDYTLDDPYLHRKLWPFCNPNNFRRKIERIYTKFGAQKAAQIVRLLREDWQDIVVLKLFGSDKLTPEQIEEFRQFLFEGMDRNLRKWDTETPQQTASNTKPSVFEFITDQCRKEGKVEAVEAELRAASKGTAPAMWKTIRTNEALGYLSTKDVAASKIYKALTAYFGDLPYNERNFRDARNKR